MLIAGFTPTYTAGFAILAVIVSSWLSKSHRMGLGDILDALSTGTKNMIITGILLVTTGLIIGTINMTGVAITFSQLIVDWSGSNVALALLLITGASLLLGMGLPVKTIGRQDIHNLIQRIIVDQNGPEYGLLGFHIIWRDFKRGDFLFIRFGHHIDPLSMACANSGSLNPRKQAFWR